MAAWEEGIPCLLALLQEIDKEDGKEDNQEDNKEEEGENQLMAVLVEGILVPIVGTIGIVGRN